MRIYHHHSIDTRSNANSIKNVYKSASKRKTAPYSSVGAVGAGPKKKKKISKKNEQFLKGLGLTVKSNN